MTSVPRQAVVRGVAERVTSSRRQHARLRGLSVRPSTCFPPASSIRAYPIPPLQEPGNPPYVSTSAVPHPPRQVKSHKNKHRYAFLYSDRASQVRQNFFPNGDRNQNKRLEAYLPPCHLRIRPSVAHLHRGPVADRPQPESPRPQPPPPHATQIHRHLRNHHRPRRTRPRLRPPPPPPPPPKSPPAKLSATSSNRPPPPSAASTPSPTSSPTPPSPPTATSAKRPSSPPGSKASSPR